MNVLNKIREPKRSNNVKIQCLITISILLLGISLGIFSKYLDYHQAELPTLLQSIDTTLDLHNFLGRFSPWIIIALCISIYSHTPIRASINVLIFFTGFVSSYYLYSYFIAGFFPQSYALIWVVFTIISPLLASVCWYAKGDGPIALIISSGIISVLINLAFSYGMFYIDLRSILDLMMLLSGILVLHRSGKETVIMIGISIVLALVIHSVLAILF